MEYSVCGVVKIGLNSSSPRWLGTYSRLSTFPALAASARKGGQRARQVGPENCAPSPSRTDALASSGSCHHAKAAAFHCHRRAHLPRLARCPRARSAPFRTTPRDWAPSLQELQSGAVGTSSWHRKGHFDSFVSQISIAQTGSLAASGSKARRLTLAIRDRLPLAAQSIES
jgi:hypothetical protein